MVDRGQSGLYRCRISRRLNCISIQHTPYTKERILYIFYVSIPTILCSECRIRKVPVPYTSIVVPKQSGSLIMNHEGTKNVFIIETSC